MSMSAVEFESRGNVPAAPDLRINIANLRQAVKTIVARSKAGRGYTFFTFNLDHLVKLDQDRRFSEAYDRADFVTADGWPIVWRISQAGQKLERTTGADLLEPVCAQAAAHDIPLYFVGPSARSQAVALKILRMRYPRIPISPRA
jgi:UDP-N-acetyl-D-mannosaminuronic acid transferase (WecB/TagA/CpsF family)